MAIRTGSLFGVIESLAEVFEICEKESKTAGGNAAIALSESLRALDVMGPRAVDFSGDLNMAFD